MTIKFNTSAEIYMHIYISKFGIKTKKKVNKFKATKKLHTELFNNCINKHGKHN